MLKSCPAGFCCNDDLHDRTGYYSRAFIAEKSSGYVRYSELIHYGIQHAIDNCTKTSGCLSKDEIGVQGAILKYQDLYSSTNFNRKLLSFLNQTKEIFMKELTKD